MKKVEICRRIVENFINKALATILGAGIWARRTLLELSANFRRTVATKEGLMNTNNGRKYGSLKLARALRFYAVTDRAWVGRQTLAEQVEAALVGGATAIQLREKNLDFDSFVKEAVVIKRLANRFGVPLIIDDAVDVATACDADGVHVGQNDAEAGEVRRRIGPNKILGVSALTVEQARLAASRGADYLGVGAVFPTSTKLDAQTVALSSLAKICDSVEIPVVAIGGISSGNVERLRGSGIVGVAVVSAIFARSDVEAAARELDVKTRSLFDKEKNDAVSKNFQVKETNATR